MLTFSLKQTFPTSGPLEGGTRLTIEGDNFGDYHSSEVNVTIGETNACTVVNKTLTRLLHYDFCLSIIIFIFRVFWDLKKGRNYRMVIKQFGKLRPLQYYSFIETMSAIYWESCCKYFWSLRYISWNNDDCWKSLYIGNLSVYRAILK